MKATFDVIIIGGGIAGACITSQLTRKGRRVLLLEASHLGSGASGAAGCWVNPVLSTRAKEYMNPAYLNACSFYSKYPAFSQPGALLRRPEDAILPAEVQEIDESTVFVPSAGFISQPKLLLEQIIEDSKGSELKEHYIAKSLVRKEDLWVVNEELQAPQVVLCTGYNFSSLLNEPYFSNGIKRVWGEVYVLKNQKNNSRFKNIEGEGVMIKNDPNGTTIIGSSHVRLDDEMAMESLESEAKVRFESILEKCHLPKSATEDLIEVRSGTRGMPIDYIPVVGEVIDSVQSFQIYPRISKGQKVNTSHLPVYPNLSVLGALGGRGFILAPYLAELLASHLCDNQQIPSKFGTARIFQRWARKLR